MKKFLELSGLVCISSLISGCCPNGCFIVSGEAYEKLAHPIPYLRSWKKQGVGDDEILRASKDCGGGDTPSGPHFSENAINTYRRSDESWREAYVRRFNDFERCLKSKGFKYVGECPDNEIARQSPACGAP